MLQYTQGGVRDSIDCRAAPRLEHVPDTECTSYKFLSMLFFFSLRFLNCMIFLDAQSIFDSPIFSSEVCSELGQQSRVVLFSTMSHGHSSAASLLLLHGNCSATGKFISNRRGFGTGCYEEWAFQLELRTGGCDTELGED